MQTHKSLKKLNNYFADKGKIDQIKKSGKKKDLKIIKSISKMDLNSDEEVVTYL